MSAYSHDYEYYVTPQDQIQFMLDLMYEQDLIPELHNDKINIFDPCAGGSEQHEMSYPAVMLNNGYSNIFTNDIREDSRAEFHFDYLQEDVKNFIKQPLDLIIMNPPFSKALDFIKKGLEEVKDNGYVICLVRSTFLGSAKRQSFYQEFAPKFILYHHKRMNFLMKNTDTVEHVHLIWQKNNYDPNNIKFFWI